MAKNIRELREQRGNALKLARDISEAADKAKRLMNEDEQRQFNAYMDDMTRLGGEIQNEERLLDAERELAAEGLRNVTNAPDTRNASPDAELRSRAFRRLLMDGEISGEERRSLVTGSDVQAGFLNAPQEFVQQLIAKQKNMVFLEGLSTQHTTTNANGLGFPTLENDVDDFQMISEIGAAPEDKAIGFGKREFKPHLSKKLIKVSDKMLRADGMDPEAIVMDRANYKFGIVKEYKYLLGSGNQEPLGLFTASAKGIDTDRDITLTYSNDFAADDIVSAKYNLKAQYLQKAGWLFNRTAVAKLAKVKTGDGYYIFEMADKIGAMDQLKGSPLYMSEYVPNTFTAGNYVGMFGDFSWYFTVNSLALRIKRLNELYAATSEVGFIFEAEFDGMPVLSEAFTRIKTGTTAAP